MKNCCLAAAREEVLEELAVYYAVVDHIDRQVGRMLDQLRAMAAWPTRW